MAYIILSSCWCGIIWNVDYSTENKIHNPCRRQL